jgi:hypothetical protein
MARHHEEGESRPVDEAMTVLGRHPPGKQRKLIRILAALALAPLVSLLISVVVQSLYRRLRARRHALPGGPLG